MIQETTYYDSDLVPGTCSCCSENTRIVRGHTMCPDCIEEIKFIDSTMGKTPDDDDE